MKEYILSSGLFILVSTQAQVLYATNQVNNSQINCNYHVSDGTNHVNPAVILKWAERAVIQSFEFNPADLESQLQKLQSCYTANGWKGFNSALQKSGNLNAIKTQNLKVSSTIDGKSQLIEAKENQWKVTLPLKVIYQNEGNSVTHFLTVYLTVSWRNTSGLGIMQMITMPHSPPISYKSGSMEESALTLYSLLPNNGTDHVQVLQKNTHSFIASLFPIITRTTAPALDKATSQALQGAHSVPIATENKKVDRHTLLAQLKPRALQNNEKMRQVSRAPQQAPAINRNYYATIETRKMAEAILANSLKYAFTQFVDFKKQTTQKFQRLSAINTTVKQTGYKETINAGRLSISSHVDGQARLSETNDHQWNITLPVQVAYQGEKGKETQMLHVDFTVDRNSSGTLEIRQLNTTPVQGSLASNPDHLSSSNMNLSNESIAALTKQINQSIDQNSHIAQLEHKIQPPSINCEYKIPVTETNIDSALLLNWAEHAAIQSFEFDATSLDNQLQKLESCYTKNGWMEFTSALKNSGNLEAIRTLNLIMNSAIDGKAQLISFEGNQWIINLPIKVAYHNNQSKVTQLLDVSLTIGRKKTGELGIIHMVATIKDSSVTPKIN